MAHTIGKQLTLNIYELIKKKRDGTSLSKQEITFLIDHYTQGAIPDYQMAAFLMAVYFKGMTSRECVDFTLAIVDSGDCIDLTAVNGFKVDKHSTGGVGDTTTLVLAPLVASCGAVVAKMTGRELGHTGGTVDKLESIPGMQLDFSQNRFIDIVNQIKVCLISQTARLAPADKMIYALRNVTATVDSIPLIASSIMSKKLAAGADGIVLDVKTGNGAFTPRYEDALELSKIMVAIGDGAGKQVEAVITSMEQPLGNAIGNALEVREAIETLAGNGPADFVELVTALGAGMLRVAGVAESYSKAVELIKTNIANHKGLETLRALIDAQGGDARVIDQPDLLPQAEQSVLVKSEAAGYVQQIMAMEVGLASKTLGAGRMQKEDEINPAVGIILKKKIGDQVHAGETIAVLHTDGNRVKIDSARAKVLAAYRIGPEKTVPPPLLRTRVSKKGVQPVEI